VWVDVKSTTTWSRVSPCDLWIVFAADSLSGNCFLSTCDEWLLPTWNCLANSWICVHCGLMCLVYSARLSARVCLPTLLLSNNTLYFLRLLPNGDTTKWRSPKNGKNWGFSPSEGNRINRSRRNLARKRRPWVCYSTPNLAVIGKGGVGTAAPKNVKFAQNCGVRTPEAETLNTFRWNCAGKCRPWVCCGTQKLALIGKRGWCRSPQNVRICTKLWFLATGSRYNEHIQMKFCG